jgi:hypothetical protein
MGDGRLMDGLPVAMEAERMVLGAILIDDALFGTASASLVPGDFALDGHKRIFRRMGDLITRGERIDRVTVYSELDRHGEAQSVGGLSALASLDDGMPAQTRIDSYVRLVAKNSALRRVIFTCRDLQNRAMAREETPEDLIASAQELFGNIATPSERTIRSIADLPSPREFAGSTDIEYLRRPELPCASVVALTGDSGSGKSTLACAWARDAARDKGTPVLILDRENPLPAVSERFDRLGIADTDFARIKVWGGWLDEEAPLPDARVVVDWVRACDRPPLFILDSVSASFVGDQNNAGEMRANMHRCRRLANLGATVIVIHHDGKAESAKDYRGSSDFKASIDIGFHVSNFGDNGTLGKLILRPFKARFGAFCGTITYNYASGRMIREDQHEARDTITDQLVTLLRLHPGIQKSKFLDLATDKGLGRNKANEFLNAGVLAGSIRRESGRNNEKRHYLEAEHV